MLTAGPAQKVTVYVGEDVHHRHEPLYLAVLNYLFQHGVAGATVTKGVTGFGARRHLYTARILEISENLPVRIEFVDTRDTIARVMPELKSLVSKGLIEVQDTTVVQATQTNGA